MAAEDDLRPFDHLVLPVTGLAAARERLTRLGFTVAPDGFHPFGTANCCVFFRDGAFLEPLAIADQAGAEAAQARNAFVRHDREFRARHGQEGLSAVVFGTRDVERDQRGFANAGVATGDTLEFARDFTTPDGARDRAAFRLAFAKSPEARDCLFFTCERVAVPRVDRSALLRHANGAAGIAGVLMTAPNPANHIGMLQQVGGMEVKSRGRWVSLRTCDFALDVVTPGEYARMTGLDCPVDEGPRFRAVVLRSDDPAMPERFLRDAGIEFRASPAGLVVPPQPGQGAPFIFLSHQGD